MKGRTQEVRTKQPEKFSPLSISNKDPDCDYSFQRRKDVEDGGGATYTQWEPVSAHNYKGETWGGPSCFKHRQGVKQFINQDTILCKRSKEISQYFKSEENEKRNHQIRFIKSVARNARERLRELDPGSVVVDSSKGIEYTQQTGPTEEE